MAKEICISSTPHETRLAILEDDQLSEIYYERENEYTLAGSIYKGRVTRVLPGMQSAFVDIGLERDAFLYVTDFLEEQEDSEDFERVPAQRPQAQQRSLSSGGSSQSEASSPAHEPAERGERPERPERHPDQRNSDQRNADQRTTDNRTSEHAGEEEGGARRWRGRRGRRRGVRGRIQPEGSETPQTHEVEAIEIEPVEFNEIEAETSNFAPNEAAATPFVLPGESLSKYGGTPAASAEQAGTGSRSRAEVTVKPSTLIEAPVSNWDGGFVLPGESLSRHRHNAPKVEPPAPEPQAAAAETESGDVAEVVSEAPVHELSPVPAPEETAAPVAETAAPEAAIESAPEPAPEVIAPAPLPEEAAPEAHVVTEAAPLLHEEEIVEEVHEFEPEEASASYRVDPAAPSEFRVNTPEPVEEIFEQAEVSAEPYAVEVHVPETAEASDVAELFETDAESQLEELSASAAHQQTEEPSEAPEDSSDIYGLAAGAGVFEEEEIDEDEFDFDPFGESGLDDPEGDDLEEETLDQGSHLGDVVRDQHMAERLAPPDEQHGVDSELDEEDLGFAEASDDFESEANDLEEEGLVDAPAADSAAAPSRRDGNRRFDRRGGRNRQQGGGGGGRQRHGGRRQSAQTMELPIISELLKQGQEILVQIAKEPIAKKGARITSHIALPGRFLVFMPTVNHVGVSRKISSDEERQRLKRILISEKGTATGGFIVRTAAEGASEDELRADIRFLINLWTEIKERADAGKAPALIYHDLNLIERILRDQVSEEFSTIWVDSEVDYERIVRFLNRFQPSLVRRVKLYTKETPLFEQFGIQDEISKALKSKVWLKSGGSIVINQTEALVAIDINTGKYVGKTARLEDTILKTNLDAIPEIVRQIRLRDLGGIIVIDFIDMDERKNRHKVMQALEEELKNDRAPSKVLQFNDFGLVAITRKRVKQSLERTLSIPCSICTGTGMVKSPATVANEIFTEMRKMQRHFDRNDVMLRVNPEVVKTLKANGARWLNELEEMTGKTIIVKSDPTIHPEQFDIH